MTEKIIHTPGEKEAYFDYSQIFPIIDNLKKIAPLYWYDIVVEAYSLQAADDYLDDRDKHRLRE